MIIRNTLPTLSMLHPVWDASLGRMESAPLKAASRMGCLLNRMQCGGITVFSTERYTPVECGQIASQLPIACVWAGLKSAYMVTYMLMEQQAPRQRRDINSVWATPYGENAARNLYPERVKSLWYPLITPLQGLIGSLHIPSRRAMPYANDNALSALKKGVRGVRITN